MIKEIVVVEQRKLVSHPQNSVSSVAQDTYCFHSIFEVEILQKTQQNRNKPTKQDQGFVKITFIMRPGTENSGITQNMHNKGSGHHTSTATPTFCILLSAAANCIVSYSFDNQPFNPAVKWCSENTCNPKQSYVTLMFSEVGKWLNRGKLDFSWWMQVSVIRFLTSFTFTFTYIGSVKSLRYHTSQS